MEFCATGEKKRELHIAFIYIYINSYLSRVRLRIPINYFSRWKNILSRLSRLWISNSNINNQRSVRKLSEKFFIIFLDTYFEISEIAKRMKSIKAVLKKIDTQTSYAHGVTATIRRSG